MLEQMKELNKERIRIRYNGSAIQDHYIDVGDLGSSLTSLGILCEIANKQANGNEISIKAMVSANFDQKCFELDFGLYLSIYTQIKTLMGNEDIATAKEIFKWLGILASSKKISGLLQAAAKIGGSEITSKEEITINNNQCIQISIEGDKNSVVMHEPAYRLLEDPRVTRHLHNTVRSIAEQGYDNLEFESQKGSKVKVTRSDASKILAYGNQNEIEKPQVIKAWLEIYSPVYDADAKKWKFLYNGSPISADISETDIAQQVMERGRTEVGDLYHVNLEIRQEFTLAGKIVPHYKILKFLDFKSRPVQQTIE